MIKSFGVDVIMEYVEEKIKNFDKFSPLKDLAPFFVIFKVSRKWKKPKWRGVLIFREGDNMIILVGPYLPTKMIWLMKKFNGVVCEN
jgi:hypothetical protein